MRSSAHRPVALIAVTLGCLCVLTGCIKVDYALEVNQDDTVSGDLLFAMDREVLTMDGKSEREVLEDFQEDAEQDNAELPGVTRVEPYREGRYLGQRVYFEDVPFEEFASAQDGMEVELEHDDDSYRFVAVVEPSESSSDLEELDRAVTASMRVRLEVTFPGEVTDTNGKVVHERTAVWRVDVGSRSRLHATGADAPPRGPLGLPIGSGDSADNDSGTATDDTPGSPISWWWLVVGGGLLAAVIAGIVAGVYERRRPAR